MEPFELDAASIARVCSERAAELRVRAPVMAARREAVRPKRERQASARGLDMARRRRDLVCALHNC